MEPCALLRWIECHPALGGYLQAVGVVLALVGSAWFTRWTVSPVLDERRSRAKVVVYRLMPPITQIRSTAGRIREAFDQSESGMLFAASGQLDEAMFYFTIDAEIPSDILAELHVLEGTLPGTIAQLHYFESRFNEFVKFNVPRLPRLDGDKRDEFIKKFNLYLEAVRELSVEAETLLEAKHP
jgi:hypothetical protein